MQVESQRKQLVPLRKVPSMQAEHTVVLKGSHLEQPEAQARQAAEAESKANPDRQEVQTPVEHELHPSEQSFTKPFITIWVKVDDIEGKSFEDSTCQRVIAV